MQLLSLTIVTVIVVVVNCQPNRFRRPHQYHFPLSIIRQSKTNRNTVDTPKYNYTEEWYSNMPLDHFSFTTNRTFALRYLINLDSYRPGGPIFFYAGNEGRIEGFEANTGLMWDLAPHFSAAIIFAEHRYYGNTQPFGNESYASVANLGYLTSEQALADYATLIPYLKSTRIPSATNAKVIVFGGSYGGMLAAWFRLKYPHIADGSYASSAPVLQFGAANIDMGIFDAIVTRTFTNAGCIKENIGNAWTALDNLTQTDEDRTFLNNLFQLDNNSQITTPSSNTIWSLKWYIRGAIEYMAMVDYPYPNDFLVPLPGWPVNYVCQYFNTTLTTDRAYATALYQLANVYFNWTGQLTTTCLNGCDDGGDAATASLGSPLGWPWQVCTEMAMPICAKGMPNDFFWDDCPNMDLAASIENIRSYCVDMFTSIGYDGQLLRPDWITTNYGINFAAASNIIFTNGNLDPWSGGGVSSTTAGIDAARRNGVYVYSIDGSGHHLDLRQPNSCDPPSVIAARIEIYRILWCWAYPADCSMLPQQHDLPSAGNHNSNSDCHYVSDAFPWSGKPDFDDPTSTGVTILTGVTTPAGATTTPGATDRVHMSLILIGITMLMQMF